MRAFKLHTPFQPKGDQPAAIEKLAAGLRQGRRSQVLLGITGSGKTFTMANVIAEVQRPTLILAHNKTLAAQLYQEFKAFFLKTRWSILFPITTTTNPKPMSHVRTPTLKRTWPSMTK